jgi:hydroxymethylpyrimidine/phosphomethylpyrimidine kinase
MKAAAKDLSSFGPLYVLVKGGHLPHLPNESNYSSIEAPIQQQEHAVHDVLFDAAQQQFHVFSNPKLSTQNTHGTGCTLASAIAAQIAIAVSASGSNHTSVDVVGAVRAAIKYLHRILKQSQSTRIGNGDSQPMLHVM